MNHVNVERIAARIWDAETGKPITPALRDAGIVAAAFSSDGERIVTIASRSVRTWDIALDQRSSRDWSDVAARSPYLLERGVLTLRSLVVGASLAAAQLPQATVL